LPKIKLVVDRDIVPWRPVPVRLTVCGLPDALSVTVIVPDLFPATVGVNVTPKVQFDPARIVATHVLSVIVKSPLGTTLLMDRLAPPLLVRVIVCGALVEFRGRGPKVRLVGDKPTTGTPEAGEIFEMNAADPPAIVV